MSHNEKEIVIAHYNEDLEWIERIPLDIHITIYSKGADKTGIILPNIGREAHTYISHIIERYDSLSDVTVFCQGNPFPHCKDFLQQLRNLPPVDYKPLGDIVLKSDPYGLPHHAGLEVEKASIELTGIRQNYYTFKPGAQFMVTKNRILTKPKRYYEKILSYIINNPKSPWELERLWDLVFNNDEEE